MTLEQLFKSCPEDRRIVIGDRYAVPLIWVSPTTGQPDSMNFMVSLGKSMYAEVSLTNELGLVWPGDALEFIAAWQPTKEGHIAMLKSLIEELMKQI